MRILVISNIGVVRHTIEQTLLLDSHSVTTSEGYVQAFDVLRRDHSIELIITDWSIKGGTAFDLYQSLRNIDRVSDHGPAPEPFFLVTVQPERGVAGASSARLDGKLESMIALDVAATLFKPINREELRSRIGIISQIRRARLSQSPVQGSEQASAYKGDSEEERLSQICQQLESLLEQVQTSQASARRLLDEIAQRSP